MQPSYSGTQCSSLGMEWWAVPRGLSEKGLAVRAHPTAPAWSSRELRQPQLQASGTSMGMGCGQARMRGPAQQGLWPGRTGLWGARDQPQHHWSREWWLQGADTACWAGRPRELGRHSQARQRSQDCNSFIAPIFHFQKVVEVFSYWKLFFFW